MSNFERRLYGVKYWNLGDHAVGIVAVANYVDDRLENWAAYIGATDSTQHEETVYEEAAKNGCKLFYSEARFATQDYRTLLPMNLYRP